jgi:tyrosine decarboxylase/aspartate 1-decarboxylase
MNVVAFETEKAEIIKEELYRLDWVISTIRQPKAIRFVIMPHVSEEVIKNFISDFRRVISNL